MLSTRVSINNRYDRHVKGQKHGPQNILERFLHVKYSDIQYVAYYPWCKQNLEK